MSSTNPQIKVEDEQIYDILNLSPSSAIKNATNGSIPTSLNSLEYSDSPPPAPTSNDLHVLPEIQTQNLHHSDSNSSHNVHSSSLLSPNYHKDYGTQSHSLRSSQSSYLTSDSISKSLNPNSPGNQSSHSLYSEYSNPASPYFDAVSNVSQNHGNSPNIVPVDGRSRVNLTSGPDYLDINFDNAIELGGSVSSINLAAMGNQSALNNGRNKNLMDQQPQHFQQNSSIHQQQLQQQQHMQHIHQQQIQQQQMHQQQQHAHNGQFAQTQQDIDPTQYDQIAELVQMQLSHLDQPSYNVPNDEYFYDSQQIEEINKINSNYNPPPTIVQPEEDFQQRQQQQYQQPPTRPRRTPSLFSNSSRSSINEDGQTDPSQDLGNLLTPDEIQSIKRGRKSSVSRSRSRSRSGSRSLHDDEEQPDNVISTREKMLELASPNQISKRTQKHPSAYACHLCDKRFTRPYNLKSHLRTHTDERPFICSMCGKAFARQHDRKRHEDLHSGEKRFQCKGTLKDGTPYGCGRRFARADALRRHFQTEAGKICIKMLIAEEESEKSENRDPGSNTSGDTMYLSPNVSVPQLAISPPEP